MRVRYPSIVARAESALPKALGRLLSWSMFSLLERVWLPLVLSALLAGVAVAQADQDWFDTATRGSVADVRAALQAGANVNADGELDVTALMLAAWWNENAEVVLALLDAGAELEARDERGVTALMWAAAWNENPEVVRVLLDHGADASATDSSGRRAIDRARDNERLQGTTTYWRLLDASFN